MVSLLNTCEISQPLIYFLVVFVLSMAVRIALSLLKAFQRDPTTSFFSDFFASLKGFNKDKEKADYWYPFVLGVFEFLTYPILIVTENWKFLGAWLAFKTVSQWKHWGDNRPAFNRFLIGNALVVILCVLLLSGFVNMKNSHSQIPSPNNPLHTNVDSAAPHPRQ